MNTTNAKKQGLLPVYASHIWEVLAVIKCLTGLQKRRAEQQKHTNLDIWLDGFINRLELLASYMITTQNDGLVYLRKDDRELMKKLVDWVKVNGLI